MIWLKTRLQWCDDTAGLKTRLQWCERFFECSGGWMPLVCHVETTCMRVFVYILPVYASVCTELFATCMA